MIKIAIFVGGPPNLKGIKYFDLLLCHNQPLTKPNICTRFERNRCFELYHLLPGFLMDTLLNCINDDYLPKIDMQITVAEWVSILLRWDDRLLH